MSGLPDGWESDYDGRRWFYKYKPTGHVQYHFPKEGDEFPDFIDTFSPAPVLAPEERLESQQQVRRQASTTTPARLSPKKDDGGYGMSATARPVSMTWDGGFEDEDNGVFQPENFMYLGPGTYNDVSPLAEEEEEAARRVVAGGIEGRVDKSPSKGVSPLNSERTTPAQGTTTAGPVTGEPVLVPPTVVEEIHEMPGVEPPPAHDPVGIIPEMPTGDTAQAHIEKHPPPIEMADNMVLAPIETAVSMMAELPERTSPKDKKKEEPQLAPGSLRNYGAQMQPLRISKKPAEETQPGYQSYKPAAVAVEIPPNPAPLRRATFQPGEPAVNASPIQPPDRGHSGTPNALSPPQVPPKRPLDEPSQPQIPPKLPEQPPPLSVINHETLAPEQQLELSHMPSVLKPARGKVPGQPGQQAAPGTARPPQGHGYVPPTQGKHPPSMTPAPLVQKQRLEEPRMGVQRVNTVPDMLPSQRPQSTIQTGHQVLPTSAMNQQHVPKRPASVMPNMMTGQFQDQIQGRYNAGPQQGGNLPYRSPIETVPPKGLPRSATAGPMTPFPPYPVDNPPYPNDGPVYRKENPPYPEEPFVQKQIPGHRPSDPSPPIPSNRRHSSYSSAVVSPDSRNGSMSFPTQTPSPMENSRRASTNSSIDPNYTPSPVSHTSSSLQSFSPTPPSVPANQYQQGSYFTMQDVESQGHNIAARDVLRKKSLSRSTDARRSSVGADPVAAQRGSPLAQQTGQGYNTATQGVSRSQSLRQLSQGNAAPQSQPPTAPTPPPPPQGQQGLGRIEEYEETTSATVSRSSTVSVPTDMRKGSVGSSAQPSPMGSRRTSWQAESPKNASPTQLQGQQGQIPQGYSGQPMPHGQAPQVAPMPGQNPKQLLRKPSQGRAPQPQNQQMPIRDPRVPQGMSLQQAPGSQGQPMQGQMMPSQAQDKAPQTGQIPTQGQNVLHKPPPAPASTPPALAPKPVPTRLQKRSSYPVSPARQMSPQNQFPQGPVPPGQIPQGPMQGQTPPQGQPQMAHPGQASNGRVQPQVQIPPNPQQWQPGIQPMTPQGSRPVSMQMPTETTQSAGGKEGKEGKKWLKWLKGGSKSVSHSPTTPVISSPISPAVGRPSWGGGEYAQQAVWQPGQPASGAQPGFQGNMMPPRPHPGQIHPQHTQLPAQFAQTPSQPSQMGFRPGQTHPQAGPLPPQANQLPQASKVSQQPSQMPPQVGRAPFQPGQMPPQTVQAPPQPQLAPQQGQMPPRQGQTSTQPGQATTQTGHIPPQNRQSPPQQERMPPPQVHTQPQFNQMTSKPGQVPQPSPAPRDRQTEPRAYSTGGPSAAPSASQSATLPSKAPEPSMTPARVEASNISRQQAPPQRQPSPAQPLPLEQVPQPKAPEPPQPPQTVAPNTLQPQPSTQRGVSPPPPAASPGLSDAAGSSISRMSSYRRDSFSDAGSITTIEVAQAQPQPVLKPSIVQVHRRSTDMFSKSQAHLSNDSQSSSDVTPRISAETARVGAEPVQPPSNLPYQQSAGRPEPAPQVNIPKNNTTSAPLPSKLVDSKLTQPNRRDQEPNKEQSAPPKSNHRAAAYANASASASAPDQHNSDTKVVSNVPQSAPAKPAAPVVEDKWAKKPVVDYSGGDWGDVDDWDY
ncbi:general RNA polymerase II transcription factor TAF12 [Fusarium beomiforme]|uniref:General RNA polymerase II transcription factor TAF12 n=1 Tax=Fusarium beomiforme TaxID=44412 RepID=A0A9P5AIY6_9HYPO|nr:general RNA polymerase II transcription factor TAF12 [Fusarium beomiforme]